jgi:hypothetical protein
MALLNPSTCHRFGVCGANSKFYQMPFSIVAFMQDVVGGLMSACATGAQKRDRGTGISQLRTSETDDPGALILDIVVARYMRSSQCGCTMCCPFPSHEFYPSYEMALSAVCGAQPSLCGLRNVFGGLRNVPHPAKTASNFSEADFGANGTFRRLPSTFRRLRTFALLSKLPRDSRLPAAPAPATALGPPPAPPMDVAVQVRFMA